jgi:dsRNA-specific ribonuclease
LAFIVTPKKTESEAGRVIDEKSEVKIQDDGLVVTWWYKGRAFECSVDIKPDGPGGVVLMEREITDSWKLREKEELLYSEEMKTWLSPALTKTLEHEKQWNQGVPVPSRVLDWLKQNTEKAMREPINLTRSFRTHYFKVPWSLAPHYLKTMLPSKIDLAFWEAKMLEYTFGNSMLLVEALTHASYGKANTPPNTRLATIGRWLVETMLTLAVTQRTAFPMHATRVAEEDVEGKEHSQTFAVSALPPGSEHQLLYDGLKWPRIPSGTEANQWLTEGLRSKDGPGSERMLTDSDRLLEWVNLSCNHVTYAYICCQKGIYNHILHSSAELESHMEDFAKVAHHASDKPGLWLTLSVHDAPRVLSDTLLALAAAVFLDSDWSNFHRVFASLFKDHLMAKMFTDEMTAADGGPVDSGDPVSHLQRLADSEGVALEVRRVPAPVAEVAHKSPCLWTSIVKACAAEQNLDPFRGRAFDHSALVAQKHQDPIDLKTKDRQCTVAGGLRDFNFCSLSLGGIPVGPPIGAASPRSAARRCASLAAPGLTAEALKSVKSVLAKAKASSAKEAQKLVQSTLVRLGILHELVREPTSREGAEVETGLEFVVQPPKNVDPQFLGVDAGGKLPEVCEGGDDTRAVGQGASGSGGEVGAVWCPDCEMWLNGPAQWEDHKIGKKHRKTQRSLSRSTGARRVR